MSIVDRDGRRIVLRDGDSHAQHWQNIHAAFPGPDTLTRKRLAMFALREECGWTLEQIAQAWGTHRGHVSRCIADITQALQQLAEAPTRAA